MSFVQKVLREVNCPRCNAIAQERLEDQGDFVIIILLCQKCRLQRNLGLTTRKALKLRKRQQKLRELLSLERNQRTRATLQARINRLEKDINRAEIGI